MAKILLADDSPTIRRSLRSLITTQTDWEICGEAENGKMAVEMARSLSPDVIILDLSMPIMTGLDAAREIRKFSPKAHVLLFTMHASPQLQKAPEAVGIDETIPKSGYPIRLLEAVRSRLET
jgi:DNA-binding NarL/FixJ family response regulator